MKTLVLMLFMLFLFLASPALAECTYPLGPVIDAKSGNLTFCTPNTYKSGTPFPTSTIDCAVEVDGSHVYAGTDLSPEQDVMIPLLSLRHARVASIACGYIMDGHLVGVTTWTGVVEFQDSQLGPIGGV
jgi:hypothetical protein